MRGRGALLTDQEARLINARHRRRSERKKPQIIAQAKENSQRAAVVLPVKHMCTGRFLTAAPADAYAGTVHCMCNLHDAHGTPMSETELGTGREDLYWVHVSSLRVLYRQLTRTVEPTVVSVGPVSSAHTPRRIPQNAPRIYL
jgi:hypothetical protein